MKACSRITKEVRRSYKGITPPTTTGVDTRGRGVGRGTHSAQPYVYIYIYMCVCVYICEASYHLALPGHGARQLLHQHFAQLSYSDEGTTRQSGFSRGSLQLAEPVACLLGKGAWARPPKAQWDCKKRQQSSGPGCWHAIVLLVRPH